SVVDYIHLNPAKAGLVAPEQLADFRWSSLARFVKGPRLEWLLPALWIRELGLQDSAIGWKRYVLNLVALARDSQAQQERGFDELTRSWAIGTSGWKRTLARAYSHRAADLDLPRDETRALKEARWAAVLEEELRRPCGRGVGFSRDAKCAQW